MKQSKLLNMIGQLDRIEFRNLKKFIEIPHFVEVKQKQRVLQLFDIIQIYYPKFKHKNLEKETVFRQIYPNKAYSASKMNKLMNYLLEVVKKFIVFDYTRKQKLAGYEELALARFYQEKQMDSDFKNTAQSFKKKQDSISVRGRQFYLNKYLMQAEQSEFASLHNQQKTDLNLPDTIKDLDTFYVCARLEHACTLMTQQIYHVPLDLKVNLFQYEELCQFIESNDYLKVPLIQVLYKAFQVLHWKDDNDRFEELLKTLAQYQAHLPDEQLKAVQAICRSYCIRRYNKGEEQYLEKTFNLYKAHLEGGYLYYNNGIFAGMLKNLVTIGLRMEEYDWVLNIIEKHRHQIISTSSPEGVYHFNLAHYYFAKKEYSKSLKYLSSDKENTYFKVSAKRLELKIYFELNSPLLESKMTAFKIYLFRVSNKILSETAREGNNNFINVLRQIHNTQTYRNTNRINKLVKKINLLTAVLERDWLLQQLEKMR